MKLFARKNNPAPAVLVAAVTVFAAHPALAQTASSGIDFTSVLQNIVTELTGTAAKLLAALAIILLGVAALFGIMDMRKVGYCVFGIALIFGASEIVSLIVGS